MGLCEALGIELRTASDYSCKEDSGSSVIGFGSECLIELLNARSKFIKERSRFPESSGCSLSGSPEVLRPVVLSRCGIAISGPYLGPALEEIVQPTGELLIAQAGQRLAVLIEEPDEVQRIQLGAAKVQPHDLVDVAQLLAADTLVEANAQALLGRGAAALPASEERNRVLRGDVPAGFCQALGLAQRLRSPSPSQYRLSCC